MKQKKLISIISAIIFLVISIIYSWTLQDSSNPQVQTSQPEVQGTSATPMMELDADQAQVLKVVDGDTIEVGVNGEKYTVRLIGIDTPETVDPRRPVGCYGKEASNKTKDLLEGQTVLLIKDVSETDKYNRLLRYVMLPLENGDLLFVNDYLVREGFAQVSTFPPDVKYTEKFMQAQQEAKAAKKGLWRKC